MIFRVLRYHGKWWIAELVNWKGPMVTWEQYVNDQRAPSLTHNFDEKEHEPIRYFRRKLK